ncbi:MAG: hypothetical protein ACAH59_11425, partial [Pseudobdellovibrionaceae bacterium]
MKNFKTLFLLTLTGSLMSACNGNVDKHPVEDLEEIKAYQKENYVSKESPQQTTKYIEVEKPVVVEKKVYVPQKEIQVVEKPVVQEKEVPFPVEQATINDKYLVITADSEMQFTEGQTSSFKVLGRSLIAGVKVNLVAKDLPSGATFEKAPGTEIDTYLLKWTPTYSIVPANSVFKTFKVKISAQVTEAPEGKNKEAIQKLMREKELTVFLLKDQKPPTDVTIEGLPDEVSEGSITPFS